MAAETETETSVGAIATRIVEEDKYRPFLHEDADKVEWRHGHPPVFDHVNKLFEDGRTKEWPKGSLEEIVQNAVKSWEMELSHKVHLKDFRTLNPDKFKLIVNGKEGLSAEETLRIGSYNALLKSSVPEEFKIYKAEEESFESSHDVFHRAFPRGFAWEVVGVYSGPPVISYKFRHWGYFEGPFKGHAPTGQLVQFIGMGILKVDDTLRVEDVEVYYDPAELFSGLLKGQHNNNNINDHFDPIMKDNQTTPSSAKDLGCPFLN